MPPTRQPPPGRHHDARGPRTDSVRQSSPDRLYLALIPLRIFLGATMLYAGLDKLLDPAFLRASGPGSIGQQLEAFTHASPLTPLIEVFALPVPVLAGLLIALAEIAIGLGALTGLLYRVSAVAGFALSILFWLTASWTTKPYYYGPDLPYAFGWLTLALAGHGGLYTIESWFERLSGSAAPAAYGGAAVGAWPGRRAFLQVAALGAAAIAVGGVGGVTGRFLRRGTDEVANAANGIQGATGAVATPLATLGATAPPAQVTGAAGTAAPSPAGVELAKLDQLQPRHAYDFQDPATGDPAVIIRLANDHVVAYDAICTHAGCTVGYDSASGMLLCPCHGAVFDPTHDGQAVAGPTNVPLTNLPLHVDPTTGMITLRA